MQRLTKEDLANLALGSAVLGSGGGGDPFNVLPMIDYQVEQYGLPDLISLEELNEEDLVVPVTFMGAPLISLEKIPSGRELFAIVDAIKKNLGKTPAALMAAEIGGANALTPFFAASQLGIPVLDADMIGRAFPALQMSTCYLAGLPLGPAFQADSLGNSLMIHADSPESLERIARAATVAMGSSSAAAFYLMDGLAAKQGTLASSISRAMQLGRTIANNRSNDLFPLLEKQWDARLLAEGNLIDVDQTVEGGFLKGTATMLAKEGKIRISFQNEYLVALQQDRPLAMTPDILVLLEKTSFTPITSEGLRYGLQVVLMAFPSPLPWLSAHGLELVGPRAFGYSFGYQPIQNEAKR
ncbi:DUF917 domain-containing protein [Candidatus Protochlamydia phocaeensis]|uniref:DUF917 domain-containing protein n=1 Tax=Candidatus Protochlamydia phocaeensis TaxID=1414722 RepID=UPI00083829C6|nr:DUF917 domain-containing protein [Candidatus Protochlamydia phocaeensis]